MVLQESISTALDSIRANLLRSLLTTIAIVIGTASVIAMVVKRDLNKLALMESTAVEIDSCNIICYPNLPFTLSENFC